jgi:hypothetical protein
MIRIKMGEKMISYKLIINRNIARELKKIYIK